MAAPPDPRRQHAQLVPTGHCAAEELAGSLVRSLLIYARYADRLFAACEKLVETGKTRCRQQRWTARQATASLLP